jgi:hypothetical protein
MKVPLSLAIAATCVWCVVSAPVVAYEINNHADMSQTALIKSSLRDPNDFSSNGKLFRLGLKQSDPLLDKQTFPLSVGLGPIPYCFGSTRPADWKVTIPLGDSNFPTAQQDASVTQPPWEASGGSKLTIAQMIRYGACYEDEEEPYARSLSHFYNPQSQGDGAPLGPNSLDWMLKRNPGNSLKTGVNHFTYMDARDSFYSALTVTNTGGGAAFDDNNRKRLWGQTFQALGHIVHHLQDMASPQHVRSDYHCNSLRDCRDSWASSILYRPSAYETHLESPQRIVFIKQLAQLGNSPILFGLPREFWNVRTDNNLTTANPTQPMLATEGIAAYTSTNFTSAGKDFFATNSLAGNVSYLPATGLAFPKPSGVWNNVKLTDLFASQPAVATQVVNTLCAGDANNCTMQFMGTEQDPSARTSSASFFSQELLRPSNTYSGKGVFQQNFFTFDDAARKLIPTAVEYSAGLINYFFRGEMEISLPDEGVYGIVDHAVEKEKGVHGYRLIKMKVKNVTPDISSTRGTIAQHMSAGQFVAVAKFRRNTCYTPDLMGQIGIVGPAGSETTNSPATCRSAVDEIVVSNPEPNVTGLSAGAPAVTMAFDFPNPIPIEATDLFLQVVFKGKLGEEMDAVAVTTKDISEPSFFSYMNAGDVRYCPPVPTLPAASIASCPSPGQFQIANGLALSNRLAFVPNFIRGSNQGYPAGVPSPNRWMGFNANDKSIKVVEWGNFFSIQNGVPELAPGSGVYGVPMGRFSRVAFLADLTDSSAPNNASHDRDELDVTVGFEVDNFQTCGVNYDATHLNMKAKSARVQSSEDEPLGGATNPLPEYLTLRGVTLGLNAYDWRDPAVQPANGVSGGFYSSIFYLGELPGILMPSVMGADTMRSWQRRRSILQSYPTLPGLTPLPVSGISFTRAAARRVALPTCEEFHAWHGSAYSRLLLGGFGTLILPNGDIELGR